ncbi:uncharacterized protein BJ171DRAFT_51564 [Polychytrium aggregatum]|uniref:uncharacterized protein n=1 Tax=Polychytrium aggregatum TaxID=110093 RepID=UPI0022FEA81B|nr:uncharacterized protein BJ171DRAFT_51564 [Polychytrium aggregatum]KAI9205748.1 hypothetical protein BJ171DRAFT_51564 [Polychytrium aggregatum]
MAVEARLCRAMPDRPAIHARQAQSAQGNLQRSPLDSVILNQYPLDGPWGCCLSIPQSVSPFHLELCVEDAIDGRCDRWKWDSHPEASTAGTLFRHLRNAHRPARPPTFDTIRTRCCSLLCAPGLCLVCCLVLSPSLSRPAGWLAGWQPDLPKGLLGGACFRSLAPSDTIRYHPRPFNAVRGGRNSVRRLLSSRCPGDPQTMNPRADLGSSYTAATLCRDRIDVVVWDDTDRTPPSSCPLAGLPLV